MKSGTLTVTLGGARCAENCEEEMSRAFDRQLLPPLGACPTVSSTSRFPNARLPCRAVAPGIYINDQRVDLPGTRSVGTCDGASYVSARRGPTCSDMWVNVTSGCAMCL